MQNDILSDKVTIYQGDVLQILATLKNASVDAVLTDPPYSSGGLTLTARQAPPAHKYQQSGTKRHYPPMLGDAKDQRSWTHWCTLWLAECWRVAQDGAPLMVFSDWRQVPSLTGDIKPLPVNIISANYSVNQCQVLRPLILFTTSNLSLSYPHVKSPHSFYTVRA